MCDNITIVEFLRLIKEKYSQTEEVEQYTDDAKKGLFQWENKLLLPYLQRGKRFLVFGSGAGREVFDLEKAGIHAVGVEISSAQINSAQQLKKYNHLSGDFVNADAFFTPFKDMSFDCVLMFRQFIQHFPCRLNREKLLAEAKRVLLPGGLLFLSINLNPFGLGPSRIANYFYKKYLRLRYRLNNRIIIRSEGAVSGVDAKKHTSEFPGLFYRIFVFFAGVVILGIKNFFRGLMIFFLGRYYKGPEPGDHLISQVSQARSQGKIWFHNYSYKEIIKELRANGFENLKINDIFELEFGRNFPELIRRGAMFIVIVAKKVI